MTAGPAPRGDRIRSGLRGPWPVFLGRQLGRFAASMVVLATAAFGMVHAIPGDPVRNALGLNAQPAVVAATRRTLGLDDPLWTQYARFLRGLVTWDMGDSLISHVPVAQVMTRLIPATVGLAAAAFVLAVVVAIPLGLLAGIATRDGRSRGTHVAFTSVTGVFSVVPDFVLGVGLVFVFSVTFKVLPVAGQSGPESYVLPVIALAAGPAALLARVVRVEAQRVLAEDYLRTARSKRLPARLVYLRHALPNLLTAALTISGLALSSLLAGTVLVESVFAWPGVGNQLVRSVLSKDFPVVEAMAVFFGGSVLLINLAVDVLIAVVDPRSVIKET
ncbi:ABC transporter permease [Umezawaea endophytica]|uniref:ABC transporter permease n=1 Tax=Umezawaea endophytica TaxID=1654476 RepID=A0A9X3AEA7_9PSEU|nr:ABC transporter permease [Umezawaea endophytica]MCS7475725.1 ABC transporter permease [Umezawaea endophytica]